MFLAHIPAGYIITTHLIAREPVINQRVRRRLILWGILCSVAPDFDLAYFYLIDNRQHLHHGYWTHLPIYWCFIALIPYVYTLITNRKIFQLAMTIGFVNVMGHMLLDTVVGKIRWFYPISTMDIVLFHVPARYDWWVWNFVFHWTFLMEVSFIIYAIYLFIKRRNIKRSSVDGYLSRTEIP